MDESLDLRDAGKWNHAEILDQVRGKSAEQIDSCVLAGAGNLPCRDGIRSGMTPQMFQDLGRFLQVLSGLDRRTGRRVD